MKPLAMTCALAVACLHSKAQFEPHIAEGNLVACWKAGAIHSRAITSITQVRGNLRRPSQWSSKRCDTEALALGRLGRTWQPKQQAHEGGPRCNESSPLECDSHTSDVPRQHLAASRLAGETKGFAKRTAPVAGKAARRTAPRRGRSTNGYGTWRRNEKGPEGPFSMIYRLHWNSIDLYLERETGQTFSAYLLDSTKVFGKPLCLTD